MTTSSIERARADLARGLQLQAHGPAPDAMASLAVAGRTLAGRPDELLTAALATLDVAWAAGDHPTCLAALDVALRAAGPGPTRKYLRGMAALLRERPEDASAPLRAAVTAGAQDDDPAVLLVACEAALLLGDVRAAGSTAARALALAVSAGDESLQSRASERVAYAELRAGRHAMAREHSTTGLRAAWRSGRVNTAAHHHAVLALVASVQGPLDAADHHAACALRIARRHGLSQPVTLAEWARARSDLARGRPADAAARLGSLLAGDGAHFALRGLVIPAYVEGVAGAGSGADTGPLVDELARWSTSAADPHGPALVLRCRALTADPDASDELFRRAAAAHEGPDADPERARTALLHGMWLRRRRRPIDARELLRDALLVFDRCGAGPWAALARAELRAAGASTGADTGTSAAQASLSGLTPHQERIARCVAAGDTNRDIAAGLGVSVRTVDSHLRNIFVALGVRSRTELARLVPPTP